MTALRMQAVLLAGFSILVFGQFDFCDIGRAIANKSKTASSALKGVHLTAVVPYFHLVNGPNNNAQKVQCTENPRPRAIMNKNCTGYLKNALDEAARLAGFTYDLWTVNDEPTKWNGSTTQWLKKYGASYDIVLGSWTDTSQRRELGFLNPFALSDCSPRLISKIVKKKISEWEKMITFTQPFTGDLWLLIAVVAVSTALFMWWFETSRVTDGSDEGTPVCISAGKLAESVWLSLCQFTGGAAYEPATVPGRLAMFSWSFFILIVVAAYTANLAAFLTVKGGAGSSLLAGFSDAKNKRAKICAPLTQTLGQTISAWGESIVPLVDISGLGNDEILQKLESGACKAVAVEDNQGKAMLVDKHFNDGCAYDFIGERLREASTGVTMYLQGTNCASVLLGALGSTFKILYEDDTLSKEIAKALVEVNTLTEPCLGTATKTETDEDNLKLGVNSMVGIFGVHGILLTIAALLSFSAAAAERLRAKKPKGEETSLERSSRPSRRSLDRPWKEKATLEDTIEDLKTELHVLREEMTAVVSAIGERDTKHAEDPDLYITNSTTFASHRTVHVWPHGPMTPDTSQDGPSTPTKAEYQTLVASLKESVALLKESEERSEQREKKMMAMLHMLSGNGGIIVPPSSALPRGC